MRHGPPPVDPDWRVMVIAYEWSVREASGSTIATGLTDDSGKAIEHVETELLSSNQAAYGLLSSVYFTTYTKMQSPLALWPPFGEIQECRRDASGGVVWRSQLALLASEAH